MRKIVVISLFLLSVALLALVVWPDFSLSHMTRWQVERRCQALFGQKLRAAHIDYSGRTVVFYQPILFDQVDSESGGAYLSADRLEVTLHFRPSLGVDFHLHAPQIQLVKKARELPELGWTLPQKRGIFSPRLSLSIEGGALELYELEQARSTHLPLELSLEHVPERRSLHLTLKSSSCEALVEADPWGTLLTYAFSKSDCTPLARALHYFMGERCAGLDFVAGELSGSGRAWLPEQGSLVVDGGIELQGLLFQNESIGLSGSIPRIDLQLLSDPEPLAAGVDPSFSEMVKRAICQIELPQGGALAVAAGRMPPWEFACNGAKGSIHSSRLCCSLDGLVSSDGWTSLLRTEGEMQLGSEPWLALEMAWPTRGDATAAAHTHVAWRALGKSSDQIEVELVSVGKEQAGFLQSLATPLYPEAADLEIDEGVISARLALDFENWRPNRLAVDHFELEGLEFAYPPHRSCGSIASMRGAIESEITEENPIHKLEGWVALCGANVTLDCDHHWEKVEGEIHLHDGALKRASLIGHYREMEAALLLQPLAARSELHLSLAATGAQIAPYLPPAYQSPFANQFFKDRVLLRAAVTPHSDRLELEGICTIEKSDLTFHVDFDLPSDSKTPTWLSTLAARELKGMQLRSGEVHGDSLPLSRYAPVLALLDPKFQVDGSAEMVAHFDQEWVRVEYEARDVRFATPMFEVLVDRLGDLHNEALSWEDRATHSVEIATGEQLGSIPVCGASCWVRKGDLLFPLVDGKVLVREGVVEVEGIATHAEGVDFAGSLFLDRSDPHVAKLHLSAPMARGSVFDAQALCGRYSDLALWDLPIEGEAVTREDGLNLYFNFYADEPTELDIAISGQIEGAEWHSSQGALSVHEGHLTFDYQHEPQLLLVRNLDGDLLLPSGASYLLGGRGMDITDVRHLLGCFDLKLFDGECEKVRFAGSLFPLDPSEPGDLWTLELDPNLTRMGSIRPNVTCCHLRGWESVERFEAHALFDLDQISHDWALLDLVPDLPKIDWLFGNASSGELFGEFEFGAHESRIVLAGEELTLHGRSFDHLEVAGGKRDEEWWIDRLVADDLCMTGRIAPCEGGCTFCHCRVERPGLFSLLFGGDYSASSKRVDLDIAEGWARLIDKRAFDLPIEGEIVGEGSLALCFNGGCPSVESFALRLLPDQLTLDGTRVSAEQPIPLFGGVGRPIVVGKGAVSIDSLYDRARGMEFSWDHLLYHEGKLTMAPLHFSLPTKELPELCARLLPIDERANTLLTTLRPDGRLSGSLALSKENVTLHLESGEYLLGGSLHDLTDPTLSLSSDFALLTTQFVVGERPLELQIRTTPDDYRKGCALLYDEGARGSTRPLALDWRWEEGKGLLFDAIEGELCGLTLDLTPRGKTAPIHVQPLKREPLMGEGGGSGVGRTLLAQGRSDGKGEAQESGIAQLMLQQGREVAAEGESGGAGSARSLLGEGLAQGEGASHPLLIAPTMSDSGRLYSGRIEIDLAEARHLLSEEGSALLEKLGVGQGFSLEGLFSLDEQGLPTNFEGRLFGKEVNLGRVALDRLTAKLVANRSQLLFTDLQIADRAGTLFLPQLQVWKDGEERWHFASRVVQLSEVNPALLKREGDLPGALEAIAIPRAVVRNLGGLLTDKASWHGQGHVQIDSTIARAQLPAIFALPAEVLGRLGLEAGNLTPAKGGVSFEIGDGRCYITDFHNLYSRSEKSQFFLASDQGRSYIDFDGNIAVALRMKQYNLLLKFTEMFLVSVRGTVSDPNCSLHEDAIRRQRRLQAAGDPRSATFPFPMCRSKE